MPDAAWQRLHTLPNTEMGHKPELKVSLEGYWAGKRKEQEFLDIA
jgi:hypothetical protein